MLGTLSKAEKMALVDIDDRRPPVWIVGDISSACADMQFAAEASGLRVARRITVVEAVTELRDRPHGTLVMMDLDNAPTPSECQLLDRLDAEASDNSQPAVISFPLHAIDGVMATIAAPYANLLCAPSFAERVAAISLARIPASRQLQEVDGAVDAVRLQQLADEVGRIARVLSSFAESNALPLPAAVSDGLIGHRAGPAVHRPALPQTIRADDIRTMLRLRRQRDHLFAGELFADPAWDMMLDLMAARIERLKVAVSSLCIAAAVPPTTALRWIRTLTELGIFVRVADPTDGRRIFIELSDAAANAVLNFLGEAKRMSAALV